MSYLECPYCEHDCGDCFDDQHEQDVEYEHECEECGKKFMFTINYYPSFSSNKADCLNGGEHQWEKIDGIPVEMFKDKYRCSQCGERQTQKNANTEVSD